MHQYMYMHAYKLIGLSIILLLCTLLLSTEYTSSLSDIDDTTALCLKQSSFLVKFMFDSRNVYLY